MVVAGCAFGALGLCLVVATLSGLGALAWTDAGTLNPVAALTWGLYAIAVSAAQEGVFRGWLLRLLARRFGFWGAAIITSLAFAAIHVVSPGQNGMGLLGMGLFGLAMSAAVRRFGAVWWAVGFHAGWDFILTAGFGIDAAPGARVMWRLAPRGSAWLDGGAAGPEASLMTLAMLGCLVWVLVRRGGTGPQAQAKTRH